MIEIFLVLVNILIFFVFLRKKRKNEKTFFPLTNEVDPLFCFFVFSSINSFFPGKNEKRNTEFTFFRLIRFFPGIQEKTKKLEWVHFFRFLRKKLGSLFPFFNKIAGFTLSVLFVFSRKRDIWLEHKSSLWHIRSVLCCTILLVTFHMIGPAWRFRPKSSKKFKITANIWKI